MIKFVNLIWWNYKLCQFRIVRPNQRSWNSIIFNFHNLHKFVLKKQNFTIFKTLNILIKGFLAWCHDWSWKRKNQSSERSIFFRSLGFIKLWYKGWWLEKRGLSVINGWRLKSILLSTCDAWSLMLLIFLD